jgi:hypothetical protein
VRYSKAALLVFGGGLLLGLLAVVVTLGWLGPVASGLMALGLLALPVAAVIDLRRRLAVTRASTYARRPRRVGRRPRARRAAGTRRRPS